MPSRSLYWLAAALFLSAQGVASQRQTPVAPHGFCVEAGQADPAQLKAHVAYLCSDECEGRKTASKGDKLAATYIANQWQSVGLEPIKPGGNGGTTPYHVPWSTGDVGSGYYDLRTAGLLPADDWWFQAMRELSIAYSCNVCGMIPGTDSQLKNEYVVVCAHFDHLGKSAKGIYRGADDNASGTAGLLEVARVMQGHQPKRSIVFSAFSGEEMGLLGSASFVNKNPVAKATKACINMDMIGRNATDCLHVTPAKTDRKVTTLTRDARNLAEKHGFKLSAGIEHFMRSSDHASFMKKEIPSLFFNTGMHEDLHNVSDTPDKLDYDKMARVVELVRELVIKVADEPTLPTVVPKSEWSTWTWGPYTWSSEQTPHLRMMGSPMGENENAPF